MIVPAIAAVNIWSDQFRGAVSDGSGPAGQVANATR